MMDFFEAWEKRAREKGDLSVGCDIGIHAAKQALKEMMVGEPQAGIVQHWGDGRTFINYTPIDFAYQCCTTLEGIHGTEGEEVVVMVFKKP